MNISSIGDEKCCGCGGCITACPQNAISLDRDLDGYYIAHVKEDICTHCGICVKCCVKYIDLKSMPSGPIQMFGGKNKDIEIQKSSSSGGIASALAKAAINNGYIVYGAYFDVDRMLLKHIGIDCVEDLALIRGSKYLQSYTVDAFKELREVSKAVYIGTPCQIYALRKLFPQSDIILIDFRCAGTPGYKLINKYMDYLNRYNDSGVKSVNFRAKDTSWHIWGVKAVFKDGTVYFADKHHDIFGKIFSRYHDAVHDVCKQCPFMNKSYSDIRVEDAWHLMNYVNNKDYKNGFSQVSVFTERGMELMDKASSDLILRSVPNTFEEHTHMVRKTPGKLYYMLRDDNKPIEDTVKIYEREMPAIERFTNYLSCIVSINPYVYRGARYLYKLVKGGK